MCSEPAPGCAGGHMHSRAIALWVWPLVAALLVVLGAAVYWLTPRADGVDASRLERVRIALPTVPHAALLHIAVEQGYFAQQGLDVSIVPVTHGRAAMEQLRQAKVDIAAMADVVLLLSVLRAEPLAVAASVLNVGNDNAVVARRDRGIAAPRDLAGKRIGVSFGTSGEYFLWAFLVRHRVAPESVTLVDLAPNQIAQALAQGGVDSVATWSPLSADAQAALGPQALLFGEADAYRMDFLLVGARAYLQAHPLAAQKLLRALLQAEQYLRAQPQAALEQIARRLNVEVRALQPGWASFNFRVELRQSLLVTLEDQARWAMARGYVPDGPVPNLLPNLYLDALLAVQPSRVSVVH